ncbi:SGNH/GDSL hydrolase family protein [Streptomyces sp. NPDC020875]|uniref:SGNH/GDSL hydrolase family protein n=1 Tax=Streptomyces sp. NPDC020875 TaxID=3154898 RepID=UPI0033C51556
MRDQHPDTTTTKSTTIEGPGSRGTAGRRGRRRRLAAAGTAAALALALAATGCEDSSETRSKSAPGQKPPGFVWDRSPGSIAAVGDSITRSFNACVVLSDCPESSWSTGTDTEVRSVALRLLGTAAGVSERTWNFAKTGAEVDDLPAQMAEAAARKPELVTVMVGANDACSDSADRMTPPADFRASFTGALRELRRTSPKSQVYVSSVPNLKRLWETGREDPIGRQIWKLGICSSMLGDAQDLGAAATERRDRVQRRVVEYNAILKDVCGKDERCRYDGGAVFSYRFDGDLLSRWDWFHPSKDGQSALAEIAYRNITAPAEPK